MGRVEQLGRRLLDLVNVIQRQRAGAAEHPLALQLQKLAQPLGQPGRLALQLQPDRGQPVPLLQQVAHVVQEVRVFLVVVLLAQADVRVAGDGDDGLLGDVVDLEYLLDVGGDHHLRADVARAAAGQRDHPGQARRHVHDAQHRGPLLAARRRLSAGLLFLAARLLLLAPAQRQKRCRVQRLVAQMGKGMAPVDHLGRQQRPYVLLVIFLHIGLLVRRQGLKAGLGHPGVVQRAHQVAIDRVPALHQRSHRRADGAHLLPGRHAGLVVRLVGGQHVHVDQAAHPDHEELVQVAGEYAHEPHPLHQRHRGVRGLGQHPLVELQPAQLPVLGIAHVSLLCDGRVLHQKPSRLYQDILISFIL